MSRRPLSLALRLTLLFGSATAIVLPLFGWLVIHSTERHFVAEDRDDLMVVASAVHDILHEGPLPAASERLERRIADVLIGHYDTALRLTAPDGRLVYASPGPDLTVAALVAASDPGTLTEQEYEGSTYRVLRQTLAIAGAPGQYRIAVAAPIDHHLRFLAEFRRTLWSMIIASIVFMSLMGWAAVRRGHAPLRNIVGQIREIRISQLNSRLDPDRVPAELSELAVSFNELLTRIDRAIRRLSEFNADIAHELRTPIASLMTQTQVGLSRERRAGEYREILYSNMEECERMRQMVEDMLYLAKADSHSVLEHATTLDLAAEIDALCEFYGGWADERGVTITREGRITVPADRRMMQRALSNLISNAIKNTPENGTVSIRLDYAGDDTARIIVENTGEDISPEHWPRLFDRFYRIDESRKSSDYGIGLGLAIVKSIVKAHRGDVTVTSGGGRTQFAMSLPRSLPGERVGVGD